MSNHPQKSGSLCSVMSGSLCSGIGGSLYSGIGGSLYPGILSERKITKEGLSNSSARMVPKNTILLTSRAPIGYMAIAFRESLNNAKAGL